MVFSWLERILIAVFYVAVGVIGLFANSTLLFVLVKSRDYRKRSSTYYLYGILTASILACLYEIPYYIFSILAKLPSPAGNAYNVECRISVFLTYTISTVKIFSLASLSLDRYIAIKYPYFYGVYATKKTVASIIALFWLIPVAIITPLSIVDNGAKYLGVVGSSCGIDWTLISKEYMIILMVVAFILPLVTIGITNVRVFLVARYLRKRITHERTRFHNEYTPRRYSEENQSTISREGRKQNGQTLSDMGSDRHSLTDERIEKSHENVIEVKVKSKDCLSGEMSRRFDTSNKRMIKKEADQSIEDSNKKETGLDDKESQQNRPFPNAQVDKAFSKIQLFQKSKTKNRRDSTKSDKARVHSTEWSIIFSTLMLVAAFIITWSPFAVSRVIESFTTFLDVRSITYPAAMTLLDNILNPLIIIGTRAEVRERYKNLIFCK